MNPNRHIRVSIDRQRLTLVEHAKVLREYAISTSARGMGFAEGSFRTPTGNFRIIDKIGHSATSDTIFKGRVPAGKWIPGKDAGEDLILARILRLDGLDPENRNTRDRFIYIHGTNDTRHLGRPASHGCVRMAPGDIIDLFPMINEGMEVVIEPQTKPKGRLFFIDCDSTLSSIEGVDELARARGPEIYEKVAEMTRAAMHGEIPLDEVFAKRLDLIRPDKALCDEVAALYIKHMVPGAENIAADLRRAGWTPVILSGGFKQIIEPLARRIGIDHVEAVPLIFDADGRHAGYDSSHPASHTMGKCRIIRDWQAATLPASTVMMGDGASDLETLECVDAFVCFTGVVDRPMVSAAADVILNDMKKLSETIPRIDEIMRHKISIDLSTHPSNSRGDMSSKKVSKVAKQAPTKTAAKTATKTATKTAAKKSAVKGKRYTPAEKKEILDFIADHNAKNGRGGQTRAAEKYGVAQLTLSSWLKGGGKKAGKKASTKKAAAKKAATPAAAAAAPAAAKAPAATSGSLQVKLAKLLELDKSIASTEAELAAMKKEFTTLKNSL